MTAKTAVAVLLAVVGMLAIGGAWTSASADQPSDGTAGGGTGNTNGNHNDTGNGGSDSSNGNNDGNGNSCSNPAHDCSTPTPTGTQTSGGGGGDSTPTTAVTPTTAAPTVTVTPEAPSAEVLGVNETAPAAAAPAELPRTGSTAQTMGFLALALLAFGGSAILFARREEQYGLVS